MKKITGRTDGRQFVHQCAGGAVHTFAKILPACTGMLIYIFPHFLFCFKQSHSKETFLLRRSGASATGMACHRTPRRSVRQCSWSKCKLAALEQTVFSVQVVRCNCCHQRLQCVLNCQTSNFKLRDPRICPAPNMSWGTCLSISLAHG